MWPLKKVEIGFATIGFVDSKWSNNTHGTTWFVLIDFDYVTLGVPLNITCTSPCTRSSADHVSRDSSNRLTSQEGGEDASPTPRPSIKLAYKDDAVLHDALKILKLHTTSTLTNF